MLEVITFGLAPLGYAGLTATSLAAAWRTFPSALWRATSLIIVLHVTLVWHVRYAWQLEEATRNGYAGFLIFHAALMAIVTSHVLPAPRQRRLVLLAFGVVTMGALGAVFRYDVVAAYRVPVVLCAATGIVGLLRARSRHLVAARSAREIS